jgi:MiaB/RimO family radical SAM methylthiotransferase
MAERYIRAGRKEIRITAQDTASYGIDTGTKLPSLARKIASLNGDFMIRIGMMSPRTLSPILDDMMDAYGENKIFRFIHLPVQSGSDEVLRRMNRGYTAEEYESMVGKIRERISDMTISTDIIVGFPGETEEDFQKSLDLIRRVEPDIVNVTRYSKRPGTPAAGMKQIPTQISKERSKRMSELRFEIAGKRNRAYIGKSVRVLALERGKDDTVTGRTGNYRQVILPPDALIGSWVKARITGSTGVDLRGEVDSETLRSSH